MSSFDLMPTFDNDTCVNVKASFKMTSYVASEMSDVLSEPMSAYDFDEIPDVFDEWKYFVGDAEGHSCQMLISVYYKSDGYVLTCHSIGDECMVAYMHDKIRAKFDPTYVHQEVQVQEEENAKAPKEEEEEY